MLYTIQELAKPSRDQNTSVIITEVLLAMEASYEDFPKLASESDRFRWPVRLETVHENVGGFFSHGKVIGLLICEDEEQYHKVVRRVM